MNKLNYSKMKGVYLFLGLLFFAHLFLGNSSSAPMGRTGAPGESSCAGCHGGGNLQGLDGSIQISGLPAEVMPNTNYRVTVEVANPNGLSLSAGMQMLALNSTDQNAGSFANPSNGANVLVNSFNGRNYLGHNPAQPYDANRIASWSVDWTSPADPDPNITFYAVGNITDMDNGTNTSNDYVVFDTENTVVAGQVMVDLPDLTASNVINFEGAYAPDEVVEFSWDLNNLGNAVAVNEYRIVMYLSADQLFSADDVEVGEVPTGNTFPGTISGVPGAIRVPLDAEDGTYYLHLVVDNDDTVEESDETNNVFTTTTFIMVETPIIEPLVGTLTSSIDCDGIATLECIAEGGVGPYTFDWTNGTSGPSTQTNLSEDIGTTITDSAGNQTTVFTTINIPDAIVVDLNIIAQPGCATLGIVEALASGGSGNYTYDWSDGRTGVVNTELEAGLYEIIVTDESGCTGLAAFELEASDDLVVNAFVFQLDCPGVNDAIISLSVNGGSDNITYEWSNGSDSDTLEDLGPGMYSVTVVSGDCAATESYVITELNDFELISEVRNVSCAGLNDGSISVLITGGVGPYFYAWSNGELSNSISNLQAGIYTVTVNDSNGCEYIEDFVVQEPALIELILEGEELDCFGDMDGSISVENVSGGTPPYVYTWTNGSSTSVLTGLGAGTYTVTITDAMGCFATANADITEPEELILSSMLTMTESGGSIDVEVSGGVMPYDFTWTNGANTEDVVDLLPGTYMLVVTDANGCILTEEFEIVSTSSNTIASLSDWDIYPTLVNDQLHIHVTLSTPTELRVRVASLDGGFIEVDPAAFYKTESVQNATLYLGDLQAGIYMLLLESDEGMAVKRFVKM